MGVNDDVQELGLLGCKTFQDLDDRIYEFEEDFPTQNVDWAGNETDGFKVYISPCRFDELFRYLNAKQQRKIEAVFGPTDDEDETSDEDEDEPQPEPSSTVDHPSHYRKDSGYEAIDVIEAWGLGFSLGNAVKYICRAGLKQDALEDLEKARWYLDHEIERRKRA